ncbi:hypothetical protein HJG60_009498 [Phyllostomus discolor]|uniref:Uncharacterized protein n=1 Tax=Phyllostomus discolor TaxID=89673 RepID=A0A834D8Z7_9CHIR|nr:hypothetical protein HJG60_009498 [Phyllostomus discolor]
MSTQSIIYKCSFFLNNPNWEQCMSINRWMCTLSIWQCLWAIGTSSLEKYLFIPFPHFLVGLFFVLELYEFLVFFGYQRFIRYIIVNIFSCPAGRRFSTIMPQKTPWCATGFLKHAAPACLVRGADLFPLRLSNKKNDNS